MAEFTSATRVLVALVLIVVSVVAWRWMQTQSASKPASEKKKPTKKKAKKKAKKPTETGAEPAMVPAVEVPVAKKETVAEASEGDDDSDEDAGLSAKQILAKRRFKPKAIGGRAAVPAPAPSVERFRVDQKVLARFRDGPDWFPGVVLEVRRGNEYHIKYDDGEVEHHVPHARIKDAAVVEDEGEENAGASPRGGDARGVHSSVTKGAADAKEGALVSSSEDEEDDGDDSEDGWHVVEKKRRSVGGGGGSMEEEKVDAEGLTKRQRENRRKKERKKEVKEMARAQAQEHGLHARWGGTMNRLKYVPPPTAPPSN